MSDGGAEGSGSGGRPWLAIGLIGGILGTVVAVHVFALVAYHGAAGDIERPDYYEAGQAYDGELALRAAAAGGSFELRCGATGGCVVIGRGTMAERSGPGSLVLHRADDAGLDVRLELHDRGTGRWEARGGPLLPGVWRARVELGEPVMAVWVGRIRVEAAR